MKKRFYLGSMQRGKTLEIIAREDIDCLPPDIHQYIGSVFSTKKELREEAPKFLEQVNKLNTTNFGKIIIRFN